jgi:hypothetical protein
LAPTMNCFIQASLLDAAWGYAAICMQSECMLAPRPE